MQIIGFQNCLPMMRILRSEPVNPPARVVPHGHQVTICRSNQRVALAQKAAQAGIQEIGTGPCCSLLLCGLDSLVHEGKRRIGCVFFSPGQRQCRAQQRLHLRCGRT